MKKAKISVTRIVILGGLAFGLSLSIIAIQSCACYSDQPYPASDAWITFVDRSSGKSVFRSPFAFPRDSLKILNEAGEEQMFEFTGPNHTIFLLDLYNSRLDNTATSQELCKKYVFKFLYKEIDTVKICYLVGREECDVPLFSYVKVYSKNDTIDYNGAENIIIKK
jgi:hypothetical protein